MISAIARAIGQLPDPAFRRVLFRSLGLTIAVFIALFVGIWYSLGGLDLTTIGWISWLPDLILDPLNWAISIIAYAVPLLLFPAVASFFVSLFLDEIVEAVEERYYPTDPKGPGLPLAETLMVSAKFSLMVIVVNIIALPFYLIPGINLLIYYSVNGYLLSREYYELVALTHVKPADAAALAATAKGRIFFTGVIIAFFFTIPIVNFFAPLIGAAAMVHVFKSLGPRG